MERHGRLRKRLRRAAAVRQRAEPMAPVDPETRLRATAAAGAATLDAAAAGAGAAAVNAQRRAVRTHHDWDRLPPGFLEIDLVAHGGGPLPRRAAGAGAAAVNRRAVRTHHDWDRLPPGFLEIRPTAAARCRDRLSTAWAYVDDGWNRLRAVVGGSASPPRPSARAWRCDGAEERRHRHGGSAHAGNCDAPGSTYCGVSARGIR